MGMSSNILKIFYFLTKKYLNNSVIIAEADVSSANSPVKFLSEEDFCKNIQFRH
jgi:hypothetical protein